MKRIAFLSLVLTITASFAGTSKQNFRCDGRKYCSQMHSCEEAKYFLRNCPDPKMDGDNDGIPCEKQWCGHRKRK